MSFWPFRRGDCYRSPRSLEDGDDFELKRARLMTCGEHFNTLEDKLKEWNKTGHNRILTMSTTFVGLTCIGLVPAFLGTQQFIRDQETTTWMLWILTGLSTSYLFWYFGVHLTIPLVATNFVKTIKSAELTHQVIKEVHTYSEHNSVDVYRVNQAIQYLDMTYLPAVDTVAFLVRCGDKVLYLVQCLEWLLQASVFGLSLALVVVFFLATKTDDYLEAGRNQLAYTVWLFIINVISSFVAAFTRLIHGEIEEKK